MTVPQIKGVCIKSTLGYLEEKGLLEGALCELPEHFQTHLRSDILPAIWYPLEPYMELLEAVRVPYSREVTDVHAELGGRIFMDGINSTLRAFFRAGAIRWFIKRSPMLWSLMFQGTELEITSTDANNGYARIVGNCPTTRSMCRTIGGGITEALMLTGADDVRTEHVECRLDGGSACVYKITFKY